MSVWQRKKWGSLFFIAKLYIHIKKNEVAVVGELLPVLLLTNIPNLNFKKMNHFSLFFFWLVFLIISNFLSVQLSLRQRTWGILVLSGKEQVNYINNISWLLKMDANWNFNPIIRSNISTISLSQIGIKVKIHSGFHRMKIF